MKTRELMRQFTKKDLLGVAEELDLNIDFNINATNIINMIVDDVEENGIPAEEDCSPILEDFLVKVGFIDEEGDLIEEEESVIEEEEEETVEVTVGESRPQCFSFHSDRDPACNRCTIAQACEAQRLKILPECYGKAFDGKTEECKACIENMSCRELVKE